VQTGLPFQATFVGVQHAGAHLGKIDPIRFTLRKTIATFAILRTWGAPFEAQDKHGAPQRGKLWGRLNFESTDPLRLRAGRSAVRPHVEREVTLALGFVDDVKRGFGGAAEAAEAGGGDYVADARFAGLSAKAQADFLRAGTRRTE
jgi:hypothetical protein